MNTYKIILKNEKYRQIFIINIINVLGNSVSAVAIPIVISQNKIGSSVIGMMMGIQSIIGVLIFLPQATFIEKQGEKNVWK